MSPLKRDERHTLARLYVNTYYPLASDDQVNRIVSLAADRFMGNYSPIQREQDARSALGSGCTFEEYVIARGWGVTGTYPENVDAEWLGDILLKDTSM